MNCVSLFHEVDEAILNNYVCSLRARCGMGCVCNLKMLMVCWDRGDVLSDNICEIKSGGLWCLARCVMRMILYLILWDMR